MQKNKLRILLIGKGEIGQAVYNNYIDHSMCGLLDWITLEQNTCDPAYKSDLMLVTIPYSDKFVDIINHYADTYCIPDVPKIIFSTVQIGTTSKLKNAVHVPVEGKHPNLTKYFKNWQKFIGGSNDDCLRFLKADDTFVFQFEKPEVTEFLKLQSTTNYALNIEYARYIKECCDQLGMDYNSVKDYNIYYNILYHNFSDEEYPSVYLKPKRYILSSPIGKQGGHCTLPNTELLNSVFPNQLLNYIVETNKKFEDE